MCVNVFFVLLLADRSPVGGPTFSLLTYAHVEERRMTGVPSFHMRRDGLLFPVRPRFKTSSAVAKPVAHQLGGLKRRRVH